MKYKINGNVIFDAEMGSLRLLGKYNAPVHIPNTAKRLLLLLIEHHGEVVSREVIFTEVWDYYGLISSNNNLNQCVSKLRKTIKSLGVDVNIINTVPKIGFMLHHEFAVEIYNEDEDVIVANNDRIASSSALLRQEKLTGENRRRSAFSHLAFKNIGIMATTILVVLVAGFSFYLNASTSRQEIYLGNIDTCKVFASKPAESALDGGIGEDILAYVSQKKLRCPADEYLLVAHNNEMNAAVDPGVSRLFLLRCKSLHKNKIEMCSELEEDRPNSMK